MIEGDPKGFEGHQKWSIVTFVDLALESLTNDFQTTFDNIRQHSKTFDSLLINFEIDH